MTMWQNIFLWKFIWCGFFGIYLCQFRLLIQDERLSDKSCSPLFRMSERSFIECGVLCSSEEECLSLFYDTASKECIGCGNVYTSDSDPSLFFAYGTKYYRPYALHGDTCSNINAPCYDLYTVCLPGLGKCACEHTRMYNPSTKTCVTNCDSLGDTFQHFPLMALSQHDDWVLIGQPDVTVCLVQCTTDPNCYGIDYAFVDQICVSNTVKVGDAPAYWVSSTTFETYIRNCK